MRKKKKTEKAVLPQVKLCFGLCCLGFFVLNFIKKRLHLDQFVAPKAFSRKMHYCYINIWFDVMLVLLDTFFLPHILFTKGYQDSHSSAQDLL